MSPQENITVYSYRRCPFAMRVRMTLHEKNILFTTKEEDLRNFSSELRKLHPEARVPVLTHGSVALYESAVITEYLEDAFPTPSLLPKSPELRAKMRLWTYWCNHHFKHHVDAFKYGLSRCSQEDTEKAPQRLKEDLSKLEAELSQTAWLLGDTISLADIHVFPFVRQLSRVKEAEALMAPFSKTLAWLQTILSRPSFEKTIAKQKS